MVWVGSHALQKASARYMGISKVIDHSQYRKDGNVYVNDIALVKLKKELKFSDDVKPVSLPTVDNTFDSSSECWITGWGYTGPNGKFNIYKLSIRQMNSPTSVSNAVIKSVYYYYSYY